jgi:hypothetical protein
MERIDRTNIRNVMKLLREGNALYLNGKRIKYNCNDEFEIEYTYNGEDYKIQRSGRWVRNFIKKDYLSEFVYMV